MEEAIWDELENLKEAVSLESENGNVVHHVGELEEKHDHAIGYVECRRTDGPTLFLAVDPVSTNLNTALRITCTTPPLTAEACVRLV